VQSAALTYAQTDDLRSALTAGLMTAGGAFVTPYLGSALTPAGTSGAIQSIVGTAALSGGVTALRGGNINQILGAAVTGAASNYLGQIAAETIPLITNPNVTQKPYEDSVFIGADAANLRAAGLDEAQIAKTLEYTGVNSNAAVSAAKLAVAGNSATQIAAGLSNAMGTAPMYRGNADGSTQSITAGNNGKVYQAAEDAILIAQDAAQLRAQGLSQGQIAETLKASGVQPGVANQAALYAARGFDASNISTSLATQYGTAGMFQDAPLPAGGGEVTQDLINVSPDTGSVPATEVGIDPSLEDARFMVADMVRLKEQGLSFDQIQQVLTQSGATQSASYQALTYANRGMDPESIAQAIKNFQVYTPTAMGTTTPGTPSTVTEQAIPPGSSTPQGPVTTTTDPGVASVDLTQPPAPPVTNTAGNLSEAQFMAADAAQLARQGLGAQDIMSNLIASGANPNAAMTAASSALAGFNENLIAQQLITVNGGERFYGPAPTNISGSIPGGNVSEAEMISADALQLAQQAQASGATPQQVQATVEQNLLYSGVDPLVAADAAQLAANGATQSQIAQNIIQSGTGVSTGVDQGTASAGMNVVTPGAQESLYTPSGTPVEALPGYPGTPGAMPGAPAPAVPVEPTQPTSPTPPVDVGAGVGGIVATDQAGDLTPLNQPTRPNMGTFTPAPPDPSWSIPLQYPGVNPGLVGAGIRPAYEATSPVQAQYYWGRQPYFAYTQDLENYNLTPAAPVQPWGLQQGFFEQQPPAYTQIPVYGENMFVQASPQQAQFSAFTPQSQMMLQPQAQPMLAPIAPVMPAQPNYVYSVVPTTAQYSVPTSAPTA
jgi:hypothetical protein